MLRRFRAGWGDGRKPGPDDDVRFMFGAADSVKLALLISGWLLWVGSGGRESRFDPFKGVGISESGGIVGKSDELRYSLPRGFSNA